MPGDAIGEIPVIITGDYSPLDAAIQETIARAEEGAAKISEAFNVPDLASSMVTAAGDAAEALGQLGDAATASGSQMDEASSGAEALGQAAAGAGDSAGGAAGGFTEMGDAAEAATGPMEGLGESLTQIAEIAGLGFGLAEGIATLKELATESIEAAGKLQMVDAALTTFTGSGEKARDILEQMKDLASQSIFSFPELASAAQKMAALGVATDKIPDAMRAAAMAAEATGNDIGTVASAMDRVYISGQISNRQLMSLGVTMQDLATAAGTTADNVKQAFKDMGSGSDAAVGVITSAITGKLQPAFAAMQSTIPVELNSVRVAWDSLMEDLGKAVAPDITQLSTALKDLLVPITEVSTALAGIAATQFTVLLESLEQMGRDVKAALDVVLPLKDAFDGFNWKSYSADILNYLTHWRDVADVINVVTLYMDKWTGDAAGAQAAAERLARAHDMLATATSNSGEATEKAAASTTRAASAHESAATAAGHHADAMSKVEQKYGDYLPQADAVTKAVALILEAHAKEAAALDTDIAAYQRMLTLQSQGLATQHDVSVAMEAIEKDGKSLGLSQQDLADKITLAKAAAEGLDTVIAHGRVTIVGAAGDVDRMTAALQADSMGIVELRGHVDETTDALRTHKGAVDDAAQSWIFENGVWTTLPDALKAIQDALSATTEDLKAQTAAVDDATTAWDNLGSAESSSSKKGSSGAGGGSYNIGQLIADFGGYASIQAGGTTTGPEPFITGSVPGFGGNVNGPGFVGLLASGGPAKAGSPYIVGEEGPEFFIPDVSGVVLPNSVYEAALSGAGTVDATTGKALKDTANALDKIGSSAGAVTNSLANTYDQISAVTQISGSFSAADGTTTKFNDTLANLNAQLGDATDQWLHAIQTMQNGVSPSIQKLTDNLTALTFAINPGGGAGGYSPSSAGLAVSRANFADDLAQSLMDQGLNASQIALVLANNAAGIHNVPLGSGPGNLAISRGNLSDDLAQALLNSGLSMSQIALVMANQSAGINNVPLSTAPGSFAHTAISPQTGLPQTGPAVTNPGTGGVPLGAGPGYLGTNVVINMSGATIYGTQGADMMANSLTNALRTNAGLKLF